MGKSYKKRVWSVFRYLIGLGVTTLMAWTLYRYRQEIISGLAGANYLWLGLALGLNLVGSLVYVRVWWNCARHLGGQQGYRGALLALSVAGAARYLPGAIWPVAGLIYFAPQIGLSRKLVPVLAALAQLLHLLVAGLVGVVSFGLLLELLPGSPGTNWPVLAGLVLTGGLGIAAIAGLPRYLLKPLLTKFFRPEQTQTTLRCWQPAGFSALFWFLNGLKLACLGLAFGAVPLSLLNLLYLVSAGAAITLLSGLFFFVPLGLGVIEISLAAWLALLWPWPIVLVAVTFNRVLRTINDLVFMAIAWFSHRLAVPLNPNDKLIEVGKDRQADEVLAADLVENK